MRAGTIRVPRQDSQKADTTIYVKWVEGGEYLATHALVSRG